MLNETLTHSNAVLFSPLDIVVMLGVAALLALLTLGVLIKYIVR